MSGERGASVWLAPGIFLLRTAILLAASFWPGVAAWSHDGKADSHQSEIPDTGGEHIDLVLVAGEAPVLVLAQGRTYRVAVHPQGVVELHLHGYDLTARAAPGSPALFDLVAEHTGRFAIEIHADDDLLNRTSRAVAFIEVRREPAE